MLKKLLPVVVVLVPLAACSSDSGSTDGAAPAVTAAASTTVAATSTTVVATSTTMKQPVATTQPTTTTPMSRDTFLAVDECIGTLSMMSEMDRASGHTDSLNEERDACANAIDQLEADRLGDTELADELRWRQVQLSLLALKILSGDATEQDTAEFDATYVETSMKLSDLLDELYGA